MLNSVKQLWERPWLQGPVMSEHERSCITSLPLPHLTDEETETKKELGWSQVTQGSRGRAGTRLTS